MKNSIRFLAATVVAGTIGGVFPEVASAVPTQWSDNGHWYEPISVNPGSITWTAARDAAIAKGGHLATITSSLENDFVFSLISGNNAFWRDSGGPNITGLWLGGYQTDHLAEPAGHWAWVTGEAWSYTNWSSGEPNNFYLPGEDYLNYHGLGGVPSKVWNDSELAGHPANGAVIPGYIVEYNVNPVPEPASLVVLGIGMGALLLRSRTRSRR